MIVSPNMGLNIPEGSDVFDYKKYLKENLEKIDENFMNIPLAEEFTATEGQTVFNLASSYTVGNNSISVEVDGVPQELGTGFTETSSTSITLSEGVPAGAVVSVNVFKTPAGINSKIADLTTEVGYALGIIKNINMYKLPADADYTQAMIRVLADLPTGGRIEFPSGDFIVNDVSLPSNILIKGAGRDVTTIKRNANNSVFKVVGTPLPDGGSPSHWNIGFEDLTISSQGTFTSDLTSFQGVTAMYFHRMKFYAFNCRLMYTNQLWDSRILNVQFFNGGRSDGTPALELDCGVNSYRQTKETVIDGCHFEGYAGPAIRAVRDGVSPTKVGQMTFSNLKFESKNCTGNHLNLEINNSFFDNVYVTTEFTTTDVINMKNCRGLTGTIGFFYVVGTVGAAVAQSLIKVDAGGYLSELKVLVGETQPSNANVITIDPAATRFFVNITATYPLVNGVTTNMGKVGAGRVWFDSNSRPRISAAIPSNLDTSGYELVRRQYGSNTGRPTGLTASDTGTPYFDQTVTKNLFWNGSSWRDAFNCMPENVGINVSVSASATSLVVTLPTAEASSSYAISVCPAWNTTYWITNKTNTGFTINFGTAPGSSSTLDWSIKK